MPALLFAYGTLQDPEVRRAVFGREVIGQPGALPGYVRVAVTIDDPAAPTGKTQYFNLEPAPDAKESVPGTVLEIGETDLAVADDYEQDAGYRRRLVTLHSGEQAWVYLRP